MKRERKVEVECEFCTNLCKVKQSDMSKAPHPFEVVCKECMRAMLVRWRKTGILSMP